MGLRSRKAMNCGRCSSNQRLEGVEYCSLCLCKVIERRVKKALSKQHRQSKSGQARLLIPLTAELSRCAEAAKPPLNLASFRGSNGKLAVVIACHDPGSLQCAAAAYLARRLLGAAADVRLAGGNGSSKALKNKTEAVITPICADDLATAFLGLLIGNGGMAKMPNSINILESVTEKELAYYASMKKIKYTEEKKGALKLQIQDLQARYPGTVEALARSGRQFFGKWRVKNE